eukprot:EG_transcript_587
MLHYKTTFESASNVTEDILSTTSTLVDIRSDFPDFTTLMNRLSVKHRALFCRVLALFIYSPHSSANAQLRVNHTKADSQLASEADGVVERNQSLVIDDAHLLGKIINLLKYQINVIDSLQYGNFLALLISINDESAPTAGAGAGSAAAPASAGAPPDPPAPAPLSTLFSSSLDAAPQGMPNLSDILLAGGFPVGGVYEMAPAALPPAFPDVAADGHLPSSSPEALPVDVPLSWESAPPPPPLLSPTSSSTLLLSSPTTVATTSPVDPTEVVSTAPSLAAPEADPFLRPDGSDDGRWAAPRHALPPLGGRTGSQSSGAQHDDLPSLLSMPYPDEGPSESSLTSPIQPPILTTLITSFLNPRPSSSSSSSSSAVQPPPQPLGTAASGSAAMLPSHSSQVDEVQLDAEHDAGHDEVSATEWLNGVTTPLLMEQPDIALEDIEMDDFDASHPGSSSSRTSLTSLQQPTTPQGLRMEARSPSPLAMPEASPSLPPAPPAPLNPITPEAAPPPGVSPVFPTTPSAQVLGAPSSSALARSSLLDYIDGSVAAEDDEATGANRRLSLQSLTVVSCQVEVLFVLSALLSGKRKVEVRERLTQLRLLHVLNDIFDFIFWEKKRDTQQFSQSLVSAIASALGGTAAETSAFDVSVNLAAPGGQPPGSAAAAATPGTAQPAEAQPVPNQQHAFNASHPADCDCRPEAARRIQYLRLIHKYCDCADYHHLHKADPDTRESKRRLARKLVACLLRHKSDTNCRYWLASCLEAILRGNHWHHRQEDQITIADKDLLPHLVNDVVHCMDGGHTTTRLQSSFDLLAELIKFNRQLFDALNQLLQGDPALYRKLCEVVCGQLVHSNVFLRSIVLSLHFFRPSSLLHACQTCSLQPHHAADAPGTLDAMQVRIQAAKDAVRASVFGSPAAPRDAGGAAGSPLLKTVRPAVAAPALSLEANRASAALPRPGARAELPEAASPPHLVCDGCGDQCKECCQGDQCDAPYDFPNCLVTRFIREYKVVLVRNLMVEIRLDQINKENICCINTALVFFLFAQEAGCLEQLLLNIQQYELEQAQEFRFNYGMKLYSTASAAEDNDDWYDCLGRRDPFRNFHKLMKYWVVYYEGRTHDTETIFHSSRIPWNKWWGTVVALLDLLPKFYLNPEVYRTALGED